jgi:cytochrome bd-type quinol oxidase subunit 2
MMIFKAVVNESYVSSDEINQISDLSYWQFAFYLGGYSFAGLFFFKWTHLSQAKSILVGEPTRKSLKAILLLWLIPFANLIKPLQHILGFLLVQKEAKSLESYRKLITAWWVLWLMSGPLGRILMHFIFPQENLEQSYFYLQWYIFIELLSVLTGLLFLLILRRQLKIFKGYE